MANPHGWSPGFVVSNIVYHHMEVTNNKQPYESPEVEIVKVKSEGIICASGKVPGMPGYPGGGDPFNP